MTLWALVGHRGLPTRGEGLARSPPWVHARRYLWVVARSAHYLIDFKIFLLVIHRRVAGPFLFNFIFSILGVVMLWL